MKEIRFSAKSVHPAVVEACRSFLAALNAVRAAERDTGKRAPESLVDAYEAADEHMANTFVECGVAAVVLGGKLFINYHSDPWVADSACGFEGSGVLDLKKVARVD